MLVPEALSDDNVTLSMVNLLIRNQIKSLIIKTMLKANLTQALSSHLHEIRTFERLPSGTFLSKGGRILSVL